MSLWSVIKSPYFMLRQALDAWTGRMKYGDPNNYNAQKYWEDRHKRYGFDLRGVGNQGMSSADNEAQYAGARTVFLDVCQDAGIDFANGKVLDVGCGVGFYAGILQDQGVPEYTGLDITNALFNDLRGKYSNYQFRQLDISTEKLDGQYDPIIMIDVTQHITNDDKFAHAMQNLNRALKPGGTLILTSWLSEEESHSFYERSRTLAAYQAQFPGWSFSEARPFRDKFIFSVHKPENG